jgi:hypothetical protein
MFDRAQFSRDGFAFSELLNADELLDVRTAIDDRLRAVHQEQQRAGTHPADSAEIEQGVDWQQPWAAPFVRILRDDALLDVVSSMCGLPFVVLRVELFTKRPRSGTIIPMHQDTFTTHTGFEWTTERAADASGPHPVTLWVALDDVSIANGGMEVVPGRHRELLNRGLGVPEGLLDGAPTVAYALQAGHAGLHHPLAPHRSHPNTTDVPRRAFLARFSPRTPALDERCAGGVSHARESAAAAGWPEWPSAQGRYTWIPADAAAIAPGYSMNRVMVCCAREPPRS